MPLSDWELIKTPPQVSATIDTTNPVVGSGSLDVNSQPNLQGSQRSFALLRLGSAQPRGFTTGRVRTLVKPHPTCVLSDSLEGVLGCFCMLSSGSISISAGSGSVYLAGFNMRATPGWVLWKFTNGIHKSTGNTKLFQGVGDVSPVLGTVYALELVWQYDPVELGGTRLVLKVKQGTDYINLATIIDLVDTSSPLTTSVGEGIGMYDDSSNSPDMWRRGWFDQTQILRLIT